MILAFKPHFKQKILDGVKVHTIREDSANRWIIGKRIHFATGVRTKKYECFKESIVVATDRLYIEPLQFKVKFLGGEHIKNYSFIEYWSELPYSEVEHMAINDGFDSVEAFFAFFRYPCVMKLITWAK